MDRAEISQAFIADRSVSRSSFRILEVTGDHEQLDVFSTSSCRILEVTEDHERMYVSSTGDFFGYAPQNHHNQVSILRPCSHNLDFYRLSQTSGRHRKLECYNCKDEGR